MNYRRGTSRRTGPTRSRWRPDGPTASTATGGGLCNAAATLAWFVPNAGGHVTLAADQPVGCSSIADDGENTRVALKRRSGENLMRLLLRLDEALVRALDNTAVGDEINPRC